MVISQSRSATALLIKALAKSQTALKVAEPIQREKVSPFLGVVLMEAPRYDQSCHAPTQTYSRW